MAEAFSTIYQRACERKGGSEALEAMLSTPLPDEAVANIPNDRFLAAMTKQVFQSGFVWRVIEQKWPNFEAAFFNFDIEKVLLMPDEMLEQKASDKRIVRNYKKVMTVRENALMIKDVAMKYGSFGAFVAQFEAERVTELWQYLKRHGARLGGNSGPYMLRALGVDTFLLTADVEDYLRKHDVFDGGVSSKRSLAAINAQFVSWQQESGRSLTQIGQIISYSWGANRRR
ncbi:DNA-3-methyladenine glycosylase I [Alteromonas pelagimontana]|uniref:DNA-3-methyladenine glycosylase I n=1 Tax=Alteromonas pelagimontana TaxID=1858656 RepID=A0A6M4ME73_9ALTE|nr:DNA-3-methyladenine glycosylase I [Alteromonas pelagimontana]QJR81491.1 DNA-3-methyladenine glycosylase I [Alteromonas pelagimontana]